MMRNFFTASLVAVAALASVASARATTVSYTFDSGLQTTDFTDLVGSLNYFDATALGGTLTGVTISLKNTVNSSGTITNTSAGPATFQVKVDSDVVLTGGPAALNAASIDADPSMFQNYTNVDPNIALAFGPQSKTATTTFNVLPTDLSQFIGTGSFNVFLSSLTGFAIIGGGANVTNGVTTQDQVLLTITYDYSANPPPSTDTPEPASVALLGAGLFGLGLIRRRKH